MSKETVKDTNNGCQIPVTKGPPNCNWFNSPSKVRALYKGLLSPLWSVSAMNAVFFGVYTTVLQAVDDDLDMPKIRLAD